MKNESAHNSADEKIIRAAKALAKDECANYWNGQCLQNDCPCFLINRAYPAVHNGAIDCNYFINCVMPLDPELKAAYRHELFKDEEAPGEGWKECQRCHSAFLPRNYRQRYCSGCGAEMTRCRNRERQRSFQEHRRGRENNDSEA